MQQSFIQGFKIGIRQWRIAAIVYFLQLCLAFTIGMEVYDVLKASIGNSLEINKLLHNYDHTVFTDFLEVHGASITPLVGQLRWLLLVWLFFSVFTDAGLLYCAVTPQEASWRTFWQAGANYFFRFLKISLVFLLLAGGWTVLLFLPVGMFFQPSIEYFPSEAYTVWITLLFVVLWLIGLAELFLMSVLSRLQNMQHGSSLWLSLRNARRVFVKNRLRFMLLLLAFLALQLLLIAIYIAVEASTGMTSAAMIICVFVIQQAFVFFRLQIRQMMYAGIALAAGSGKNA